MSATATYYHEGPVLKRTTQTAPASEPLTTAEVKTWLYVTGTDHDTLIDNLIKTARQKIETDYDCALISQTLDFTLDKFPRKGPYNPHGAIVPVVYPLASVTSISYIDENGDSQTWDSANYVLETPDNMPHQINMAYDVTYPQVRAQANAITVRVVAGYGASASDVPEPIRTAMQLMVKFWFDNPEDIATAGNPWNRSAKALLNNFFAWRI